MKAIGEEPPKWNKTCPNCKSNNAGDAAQCSNCQTNLSHITPGSESSQVATKDNPKYEGQGSVVLNPNMPILSSLQPSLVHSVVTSSEISPFKRNLSYNGEEKNKSTEAGAVPMGDSSDKIVHLSVDDPDNSDESHLQSVVESADSLAIE